MKIPFCASATNTSGAEPNPAPPGPPPASNWSVWRTDDNGNTFLVRAGLAQEEARRLVAEFSARGHKQLYFVEEQK